LGMKLLIATITSDQTLSPGGISRIANVG